MDIISTTPRRLPPPRPPLLVRVRVKRTKRVFAQYEFVALMGPTHITNWVLKQAALVPGEFEYQIGKGQPWTS